MKTNTGSKAEFELDILLKATPDAVIRHFVPEVLALVEAFGNSGQSGGSAPMVAGVISSVVKKLCLQEPISPIMGIDEEWMETATDVQQNRRCSALFKEKDGSCHYNHAIIWEGSLGGAFHGSVDIENGKQIHSSQKIKGFPFTPKTFYINVTDFRWADKDEIVQDPEGDWWTHHLIDESQLKEVFEYYAK